MTAIDTLRNYRYNLLMTARLTAELDSWTKISHDHPSVNAICDVLRSRYDDIVAHRLAADDIIASVDDPKLRLLLQLHYIDGHTLQQCGDIMHYDTRWISRLLRQALDIVDGCDCPTS